MDLNRLIPNKSEDWQVRSNFLMIRKLDWIPICYIDGGVVYVFLDARVHKAVIKLTKHLISQNFKFYFTTPELSNPKGIQDAENKIIYHYLNSYTNKDFYRLFKKLDFDLIKNMVDWAKMTGSFHLIKLNYETLNKMVQRKYHDYYSGKDIYNYNEEIREEFNSLWRDIQISQIL